MNSKMLTVAAALIGIGMSPALATVNIVTIDALPYYGNYPTPPGAGTSADYVNLWNSLLATYSTPPAGYTFQSVASWNNISNSGTGGGVNQNIAYHDTATFTVYASDAGTWNFRTGIDFGYGGTLIVNGHELQTQASDMWWNDNYYHPSQYLQGSLYLAAGTYTLNVYGAENCCDGGTQGQYLAPGQTVYRDFTSGVTAVPEISTWAMMLAGFAGLGFVGFARAKKNELAA